jgi:hypothetical protein
MVVEGMVAAPVSGLVNATWMVSLTCEAMPGHLTEVGGSQMTDDGWNPGT